LREGNPKIVQLLRWAERTWVASLLEGNDELIGLKVPGPEWRVRTGVVIPPPVGQGGPGILPESHLLLEATV
jgi:hypothetical protein